MPRVLVTLFESQAGNAPHLKILRQAGLDIVFPPAGVSLQDPGALVGALQGIQAVLASIEPYTREVLGASELRVVARCGAGYDSIDLDAANDFRIIVTNTPGVNKEAAAEHTLALMLAVAHRIPRRDRDLRGGCWRREPWMRLASKTLGLVGLGAVGQQVAIRAGVMGLKLLACDPAADHGFAAAHAVKLCGLDELLARSDIVSLHLPCTPETAGLINADTLARMKAGVILVNTARGGLVDEDALVEALRAGHLSAGLDVFKTEPLPPDHPLTRLDNVLLSPHVAGWDRDSLVRMALMAAENIADLYQGRWPEGRVVNPELRSGWRWGGSVK